MCPLDVELAFLLCKPTVNTGQVGQGWANFLDGWSALVIHLPRETKYITGYEENVHFNTNFENE